MFVNTVLTQGLEMTGIMSEIGCGSCLSDYDTVRKLS